ncbi:hypothetical protein GA0061102_100299 [Rhizobium miluonense]|uniref:Uncharacterized protein n=1 Tax=Rhizobium miluonense TaxID=411945 RepID=A0A1C3U7P5_9HYPH|nr:hypothetical protein GA0061102_100299 [Rhizobium miluonense]
MADPILDPHLSQAFEIIRDATLAMPKLILPSVQINMRGGKLPPVEDNGVHYLKIPVNAL